MSSIIKVDTIQLADGTAGTIENLGLATGALSHRNLIINGAMQVAQRGTSTANLGNGNGNTYTLDRFKFIESGNMTGDYTISQETDAPDGFGNSLKMACTTTGTGHNVIEFTQWIEAQNLQGTAFGTSSAKSLTLSFWVKCNQTGTGNVSFYNLDALRQTCENYTINAADTWEYKTMTVSGDTSGGFNNDNGGGLGIYFPISASASFNTGTPGSWGSYADGNRGGGMTIDLTSSTSDYLQVTGVQLEVGSVATPFEHRSYGEELARCQRYFWKASENGVNTALGSGSFYTTTQGRATIQFPVEMRESPTLSVGSLSNVRWQTPSSSLTPSATSSIGTSRNLCFLSGTVSGATAGQGTIFYSTTSDGNVTFDAEL